MRKAVLFAGLSLLFSPVFSQNAPAAEPLVSVPVSLLNFIVAFLVLIAVMLAYITLTLSVKNPDVLSLGYWVRNVTGEDSEDVMLDHKYDGISELDNPMPAWLRMILWGSIVWGFIYLLYFHVFNAGNLSGQEYKNEVAEAEANFKDVEIPEDKMIAVTDAASLGKAKETFIANCAACHKPDGGGIDGSGPNLTDDYWLHGGDVKDIYKTITNGVQGKAMISWKKQISSPQRLALASYILSLNGSNPAGAKKPEGVLAGAATPAVPADSVSAPGDSVSVDSVIQH